MNIALEISLQRPEIFIDCADQQNDEIIARIGVTGEYSYVQKTKFVSGYPM